MLRRIAVAALVLILAGPATGRMVLVTDGGVERRVYHVDNTETAGTYEVFQSPDTSGGVAGGEEAACWAPIAPPAAESHLSAVVYTECMTLGVATPVLPRVMIFSASTQKLGPCEQGNGHCIAGYVYVRVNGYWQGTLVLSSAPSGGEPAQTLTIPIPPDHYRSITVRLQSAYTQDYTAKLRVLGGLNELQRETSRSVRVLAQPPGQPFWAASAEYASYVDESVTAIVTHVAPRSHFCAQLDFANGYVLNVTSRPTSSPTGYFGGALPSTAAPQTYTIGPMAAGECQAAAARVTEFRRVQEVPLGGTGATQWVEVVEPTPEWEV